MPRVNEKSVLKARKKITELRGLYKEAIKLYLTSAPVSSDKALAAILNLQDVASTYFNYVETFVGESSLLGAHKTALWAQGYAEDCAAILDEMPEYYELLKVEFSKHSSIAPAVTLPSKTAFANMQRMVKKYLEPDVGEPIREAFVSASLPVYGFDNEEKDFMSKKLQIILSSTFGVIAILLTVVISFFLPHPSDYQYATLHTFRAIAGAGVVAMYPGFIEVKLGKWLRSGGALAAFVFLYTMNPPAMNTHLDADKRAEQNAPVSSVETSTK